MWSNARSDAALEAQFPVPIEIRPLASARRMRLRFDDVKGVLTLTCPHRASRRKALAWALDQRDWIDRQLQRRVPGQPFVPGGIVPVAGVDRLLAWDPALPRRADLGPGELRCGGPVEGFARRIAQFLRAHALETMRADVADYCALAGLPAAPVSVGDASTRWGSCSSSGTIRLSWRLICAPPNVRRYVVAHEVAHLRHLDHSARFRALEASLFGSGLAAARSELRQLSPVLRRIGRD